MLRILIMVASLWMLEFLLIYRSKKEQNRVSLLWVSYLTLINLLETMYLVLSEIFG